MARGNKKGGKPKKVAKVGITKESGFLYFIDKAGDISCAKMVRGGKKKKAAKKVVKKAAKKVAKKAVKKTVKKAVKKVAKKK
ncbi:MAG: hypothetical protein A2Y03_03130 [Omnitrophica WOR_2 bacterium GWF2_38_59]|nr:MAG: hypothetical protein A2Y06_05720 [Omnitrophica WOR_2 bacterium GWA2_37_7]OGX26514.1 MAG: hypothetical protein A2Y03_03130 [Omnitrophica WOR_2 bacterium GWF2_38_59]OGX49331.1 MAG: hypothetical protein A2243_08765 [Omnitrophica WOR_2 bacterium RIFOXYA2_FULL_38_17]OGX55909.1 MAG: hypothetical protein A2447_04220 [Omnitrophica WOR_2 bacterium RIFOXYC2_FULL_38_12]OGX58255.1 MAG: hypothetical protein A2306_11910 [Omnitrophica WOR_2 bacterium RIFOXYB2_FULL_38_16]